MRPLNRSVYRVLNLPCNGWQVPSADLNCSELVRPSLPHRPPEPRGCTAVDRSIMLGDMGGCRMNRPIFAALALLVALTGAAMAQDYPNRPIRFIHGFPPG